MKSKTQEKHKKICHLYKSKMEIKKICTIFEIKESSVWKILYKNGFKKLKSIKFEGKINNWTIIEKTEDGEYYCICKCGNPKIMSEYQLKATIKNKSQHCIKCSPRNKKR